MIAMQLPNPVLIVPAIGLGCVALTVFGGNLVRLSKAMIVVGWTAFALTSPTFEFPLFLRSVSIGIFATGIILHLFTQERPTWPDAQRVPASSRLLAAYLVFVLIGCVVSPFGPRNVGRWIEGAAIVAVVFYACAIKFADKLLLGVFAASTINVFAAVASGRHEIVPGTNVTSGRLAGWMQPNHLAFAAAEVLIGVIWLFRLNPTVTVPLLGRVSPRVLLVGCGLVAAYAMHASQSRTALLALVLALATAAVVGIDRGRRVRTVVGLVIFGAVVLPFAGGSARGALERDGEQSSVTTLTGRTDFWPAAIDLIEKRPLVGWGVHVIESPVGARFPPGIGQAHNAFLEAGIQSGVIGLGAWALSLLTAVIGVCRLPRESRYRLPLVVASVLVLVFSFTESSPAWFGDMFIVYVLCLAVYGSELQRFAPVGIPGNRPQLLEGVVA